MIKINDIIYELNLIDIIQELKNQLSLQGINLFGRIKDLPEDLMVSCPFHKEGQERKPSCGIRKEDGWVHCFSCGESVSLCQMISRCFGVDDLGQYGLNWLKNNFLGEVLEERNLVIDLFRKAYPKNPFKEYVSEEELNKYRFIHPYLYQRKLNDKVINFFDLGFDEKTNEITFPVRDKEGNCLFVARRNVEFKRFSYPKNVEKPLYRFIRIISIKRISKRNICC